MILIDGDMLVYRVGFACDEEPADVAERTMGNYITDIVCELCYEYDTHRLFISGKGNFRDGVAVSYPYKGTRTGRKPVHKTLLQDYLIREWGASVSFNMEADDEIAIAATELNHDCIICSLDKDFLQIPTRIYDYVKKEMKTIDSRFATEWLYRQALMGDRVDNIVGVAGIGPKKAEKLLEGWETERELYDICLNTYKEHDMDEDRLNENLNLLYLLRSTDDSFKVPNEV